MTTISQLFDNMPAQWGLRGDPFLWDEMKAKLDSIRIPANHANMERILRSEFLNLTGRTWDNRDPIFIARYDQGGMSSGMVSPEFWKNTAIPLILSRHDAENHRRTLVDHDPEKRDPNSDLKMPTVKQLLTACGLDTPHDQIKLVRHSGHLGKSIRQIIADGFFDVYQSDQDANKKPFHKCQVILSFIGIEGNQAEFYGVYRVLGSREFRKSDFAGAPDYLLSARKDKQPRIWYELEELPKFSNLRSRLIVQWNGTRGWVQKIDLAIHELLPPGEVIPFPGYQDAVLTWTELKKIFASPRAHRDWKTALSASAGIYRIVDHASGKTYIGAAYGSENLWGRWGDYAKTGHGGNLLLKGLDANRFQWSIIRTLSGSMSAKEVVRIEQTEMRKHGSKAIGLNSLHLSGGGASSGSL